MSKLYVAAVLRLPWLMEALEAGLARAENGATVDRARARVLVRGRVPADDELRAALQALTSIGVLYEDAGTRRLDQGQLEETSDYRRGVRDALACLNTQTSAPVRLCAAVPVGLDPRTEGEIRSVAVDLRAAILDVIASAHRRVVLVSPFWDDDTASELAELLGRRLEAGVSADVLGRFDGRDGGGGELLAARLARNSACRFFSWYETSALDRFVAQTFHFKSVVADDGEKAYLGTANLTTSGLRSRMELGVVLTGEPAARLSGIVDTVLGLARPLDRRAGTP